IDCVTKFLPGVTRSAHRKMMCRPQRKHTRARASADTIDVFVSRIARSLRDMFAARHEKSGCMRKEKAREKISRAR
ncbi:MAG: hypothetical protein RIF42_08760, partial [Parvibaculaceae bacterium]